MKVTTPHFDIDYLFSNGCKSLIVKLDPKHEDTKGSIQFHTNYNSFKIEITTSQIHRTDVFNVRDGVEVLTKKVFEYLDELYKELKVAACGETDRLVIQKASIVWTNSFE